MSPAPQVRAASVDRGDRVLAMHAPVGKLVRRDERGKKREEVTAEIEEIRDIKQITEITKRKRDREEATARAVHAAWN